MRSANIVFGSTFFAATVAGSQPADAVIIPSAGTEAMILMNFMLAEETTTRAQMMSPTTSPTMSLPVRKNPFRSKTRIANDPLNSNT